jgi:Rieske Fe-S protein
MCVRACAYMRVCMCVCKCMFVCMTVGSLTQANTKGPGTTIAPYALKAECTHLGCLVNWREDESKYACPCHNDSDSFDLYSH